MSSSMLKSIIVGSRKVQVKEGDESSVDIRDSSTFEDNAINPASTTNTLVAGSNSNEVSNGFSAVQNYNHFKNVIEENESRLETLVKIQDKKAENGVEDALVNEVLSSMDEGEVTSGFVEGFTLTNSSIEEKKKEVRCIQTTFPIMVIDINESYGTLLFGLGFKERYPMFLTDPFAIYAFLGIVGVTLGFLGLAASLPSYCGVFSIFGIPSLVIIFVSMNIPLLKLLSLRFFTILRSVYVLIFMISGVILSRNRESSWAINIFFIMTGALMISWGIFVDAFCIPFRVSAMQRTSITVSIMVFILIVLLHSGSLSVSDYKIELMGLFNFSVVTLMSNALSNLFLLNLEIIYVAFIDPKRLVTILSPVTIENTSKVFSQMKRSTPKAMIKEASFFPASVITLVDKINYTKELNKDLNAKLIKSYSSLTAEEKKEVGENKNIKVRRKTEVIADQLKLLMHSSENIEQLDVVTSFFLTQEIDSENTTVTWLIGMVLTMLAINKVVDDVFATSVFLCLPTMLNFFKLNVSILKLLLFQFETILIAVSSFIFCLCGAILLREREYNWCYFFMFINLWVIGQFLNYSDAVGTAKSSHHYVNVVVGSSSGLIVYFIILVGVFVNYLEGQELIIPFFGNLNVTVSNQCASSGFTCVIFMFKNLFNALMHPEQLGILKGRLHLSKLMASEVQLLQGINKMEIRSKSKRNLFEESL